MQIIGEEFPIALVAPIIIAKVDSVCRAIERAAKVCEGLHSTICADAIRRAAAIRGNEISQVSAESIVVPTVPGMPFEGGIYAGVTRGDDCQPAGHLVLLPDLPAKALTWSKATKWARGLGNGARLPTRFEAALLYATVRDQIYLGTWYWTGTQFSESSAWYQLFNDGGQLNYGKSSKASARAVRLIQLTS